MPRTMRNFSAALPDKFLIAYPVDQAHRSAAGGGIRAPLQLALARPNMSKSRQSA